MSYLPFARKYRPQTFEELIGQPHVTQTLMRALKTKRIAQAYLFTGQRGIGKTSAARILAKCLNCEKGPIPTPCNQCANCTQITEGRSLDVIEIDGASNRGIDEIRSLRESVPFAPTTGGYRVYIIDEVHMLTTEAFNALLKTLEEPPAHVKFIFATTIASKIPATVLSRCQRFDFRRLEASQVVGVLSQLAKSEKLKVDEAALYAIARAAEGSLRDAEVILEQLASFSEGKIGEAQVSELLGSVESEALFAWTQAILDRDPKAALNQLIGQIQQGREPAQLLSNLIVHVRNLLVLRSIAGEGGIEAGGLIDEPKERIARLAEQAKPFSPQEILILLQMLNSAYELVRRSPMGQTILELVILKLATREQWASLEEISRRLDKMSAGPAVVPVGSSVVEQPQVVMASVSKPELSKSEKTSTHASAVAPEKIVKIWPAFLKQLGQKKMSLAAFLTDSKPLSFEGSVLKVGVSGFSLNQEVLSADDNRRLIQGILAQLCGTPVIIQYETITASEVVSEEARESAANASEEAPGLVSDIVELFNAKVMDRPQAG